MSLTNCWLQLALIIWLFAVITNPILKLLFGCLAWYWFVRIQKQSNILFIAFIIVFLILNITRIPAVPQAREWKVKEIKKGYVIGQNNHTKVLLYQIEHVNPDDVIRVKGKWKQIHSNQNFFGFSFMKWTNKQGIYHSMYVQQYQKIDSSDSMRSKAYRRVMTFPQAIREPIRQSLFGVRSEEESLPYMITSSGMHLSMVAYWIERGLLLWLNPFAAFIVSMMVMIGAGSITVFTLALKRIMLFRITNQVCKNMNGHDRLGICMLVFLFVFPWAGTELSFVIPVLFRFVGLFKPNQNRFLTAITILIPIQLRYFYRCDIISIFTFSLQRYVYAIYYTCGWLSFIAEQDIGFTWMYSILSVFSHIPTLWLIGYPGFFWLLCWMKHAYLQSHYDQKSIVILIALLLVNQYRNVLNPLGEVMFVDVGQGDCALITLPFGQGTIMIDVAGHRTRNIPESVLKPILDAKAIEQIDYLIISHDDLDHSGGRAQLEALLPVHHVVTKKDAKLQIGNAEMQILLPDTPYSDKNDNSLVVMTKLGSLHYLFTGDAGKQVEHDILNAYPKITTDVLKVGHHGSKTSSASSFLHQLHPMLAVISSGYENRYGHPHQETLDNFIRQGIAYRNTANDGAVSIMFMKNLNLFRTATYEFDIISGR